MNRLKGWKYVAFISAFVGSIGLFTYPIIIHPMIHIESYSKFKNYKYNRSISCKTAQILNVLRLL